MYRDDGFLLAEDNADKFERRFCSGTLLTLTNKPEHQPYIPTIEEVRSQLLETISQSCQQTILNGIDVTLSDNTVEHFSLEEADQINLTTAYNAVQSGAAGYPYHANNQLCKIYSAEDIIKIGNAATAFKLHQLTYCNHLMEWVRRANTVDELNSITYGAQLPEDLANHMQQILTSSASI